MNDLNQDILRDFIERGRRAQEEVDRLTNAGFTCPRCGKTSHNRNDIREGYCGHCHDWTGKEKTDA